MSLCPVCYMCIKMQQISEFVFCKSVIFNLRFAAISSCCVVTCISHDMLGIIIKQSSLRQPDGTGAAKAKTGGKCGCPWGVWGPSLGQQQGWQRAQDRSPVSFALCCFPSGFRAEAAVSASWRQRCLQGAQKEVSGGRHSSLKGSLAARVQTFL